MATIINNPDSNGNADNGGGMGMVIGAIVLILILILFFVYGLPALRGGNNNSGSSVIPDKVDVNVSTPSGGGSATGTAQ
jgi:hypothetical protein